MKKRLRRFKFQKPLFDKYQAVTLFRQLAERYFQENYERMNILFQEAPIDQPFTQDSFHLELDYDKIDLEQDN